MFKTEKAALEAAAWCNKHCASTGSQYGYLYHDGEHLVIGHHPNLLRMWTIDGDAARAVQELMSAMQGIDRAGNAEAR